MRIVYAKHFSGCVAVLGNYANELDPTFDVYVGDTEDEVYDLLRRNYLLLGMTNKEAHDHIVANWKTLTFYNHSSA